MEIQEEQLTRIEQKIDATYVAAEKTRKYILTMLVVTLITIALPLLAAVVMVPLLMSSLASAYGL